MISIVIRNKNEGNALECVLSMLHKLYSSEFNEIIIVDNNSTDNSIEVAKNYNCKIINIDNFSYGRAINFGITAASPTSKYVLLLSSHAIPIGNSFFTNTLLALQKDDTIAGIRYINSMENYTRALKSQFMITEPLTAGLQASCCIVKIDVWKQFKFDEELLANEDKEWSVRAMNAGYKILDFNETYFYFVKRSLKSMMNRIKTENISGLQLSQKKHPAPTMIFASLLKKIFFTNIKIFFSTCFYDYSLFKTRLEIYSALKKNK